MTSTRRWRASRDLGAAAWQRHSGAYRHGGIGPGAWPPWLWRIPVTCIRATSRVWHNRARGTIMYVYVSISAWRHPRGRTMTRCAREIRSRELRFWDAATENGDGRSRSAETNRPIRCWFFFSLELFAVLISIYVGGLGIAALMGMAARFVELWKWTRGFSWKI